MIEQSTHAATEAMRQTQKRATESRRQATTADLVSCLAGLDRGIGKQALVHLGVATDTVLRCLEGAPPEADHRLRNALTLARRLAGNHGVTTGDLLLAALSDPTAAATQALAGIGLHAEAVRIEVADLVKAGLEDDALPARGAPAWVLPSADDDPVDARVSILLGSTDQVRIRISDVRADPSGFEFRLELRAAPGALIHLPPWRQTREQGLELRWQARDGADYSLIDHARRRSQWPVSGMVVAAGPSDAAGAPARRRVDYVMWCWPLPPPGIIDVVCNWFEFGVQTRQQIDGDVVRRAANRAKSLWPNP